MKRPLSDDALRAALRAGDPAEGVPALDATERAAMRVAIDRAVPSARPAAPPFRWAAAAALILLGAVATALLHGPTAPPPAAESLAPVTTRQLDFKTPGGTRLIWVFDVPDSKEKS